MVLLAFAVPVVSGGTWNAGQDYIDGPGEDDYEVPDPNGAEYRRYSGYQDCVAVVTPNGSRWVRGWAVWCNHNGNEKCEERCTPLD